MPEERYAEDVDSGVTPEQIGKVIAFLASDAGQIIRVARSFRRMEVSFDGTEIEVSSSFFRYVPKMEAERAGSHRKQETRYHQASRSKK